MQLDRRSTALLSAVAASVLFQWAFAPAFLFFDTYHYMVLSYHPTFGDAHPLGFGFLLRAMSWVSRALPIGTFAAIFNLWQFACLGVLVYIVGVRRLIFQWRSLRVLGRVVTVTLACALAALLAPALVFLVNGYTTEVTAMGAVGVAAIAAARGTATGSRRAWTIFAVTGLAAWHVRYQLALLMVVGPLTAIVLWWRAALPPRRIVESIAAALAGGALIFASNGILGAVFPTSRAAELQGGQFLQDSIQCRLRCDVKLRAVDCRSRRGRASIRKATCTDILIDKVKLGARIVNPLDTVDTFRQVGFVNTLRWLYLAPWTYLREIYFTLEHESFGFDRRIRILNVFQDALKPYARLLPPANAHPSRAFKVVIEYLEGTYGARLFHWLTAGLLVLCGFVVLLGRSASAVFVALAAIGNYLAFAYLQPKAPFRYLATVDVLALTAASSLLGVVRR